jgi:hypothetical protein
MQEIGEHERRRIARRRAIDNGERAVPFVGKTIAQPYPAL